MKTLVLLLLTTFVSAAQAEIFLAKISVQGACESGSDPVILNLKTKVPGPLDFLAGTTPTLTPQALLLGPAKNPRESYSAINNSIQLTTDKTKIYSVTGENEIRILVKAPRATICAAESQTHLIYTIAGRSGEDFGFIQVSLVNENTKDTEIKITNQKVLLKEINKKYLTDLNYYLSEDFLWSKSFYDMKLATFFANVDEKYLPDTEGVATMLTNPLYAVQFNQNSLRINYGPDSYLEFDSAFSIHSPEKPAGLRIRTLQLHNTTL